MSNTLMEVIERAVKDEYFRNLLFTEPDRALAGYRISQEERNLLEGLNEDNFDQFAGSLDDRTTK